MVLDNVNVDQESTRDALVRAGVELLEETGSSDIGLREITRRAGVSHGAPRRYFPTHRSLLGAIARVGLADLADALGRSHTEGDHALRLLALAYIGFAHERPAMFTLIFRHDLLDGSGAGLRGTSIPLFERVVELVVQRGCTGDPELAAAAVWTGIHGIAVLSASGALHLAAPSAKPVDLVDRLLNSF